ncbi:MAG: PepSY-associated TM helix domain-containing protein [Thiobacillus sp.]
MNSIFGGIRPAPLKKKKRDTGYLFLPKTWRKSRFLLWLRRTHAWMGLWGAILGLLFGLTGFLLNHRQIMKVPLANRVEVSRSIAMPAGARLNPATFEAWVRTQTDMPDASARTEIFPEGAAPWGNGRVKQPMQWKLRLLSLRRTVNAEYWHGNTHSQIQEIKGNLWATINRLHMGIGMGALWILLGDSLAVGLFVLSASGLLLWSRLHGPRLLALGLMGTCLLMALSLIAISF